MSLIYLILSIIGWAWAILFFGFLLVVGWRGRKAAATGFDVGRHHSAGRGG